MRLRTFDASDMSQALKLVRDELGDDAVIVSTVRAGSGKGIKVTAAVEQADEAISGIMMLTKPRKESTVKELENCLAFHSLPESLHAKIIEVARYSESSTPLSTLSKTFSILFSFAQVRLEDADEPIMLVGAPGVGKTITAAKLATDAVIRKIPVRVITTDCKRAGGVEQLKAFTDILELELEVCEKPSDLGKVIRKKFSGVSLIDTAGVNPYSHAETRQLSDFLDASNAESVMVMAAGSDASETSETAEIFSKIGATKLIVTRAGSARRFGSVLTAANNGKLAFAGLSGTSAVSSRIEPIDPKILAGLFLKHKLRPDV